VRTRHKWELIAAEKREVKDSAENREVKEEEVEEDDDKTEECRRHTRHILSHDLELRDRGGRGVGGG